MALPYQAYNLIPNIVDGKQRMGDWDGTFVPDVGLPAPTNLRITSYGSDFINYAWDYTDTQHKNFTLDMSVPPAGFTPRTTTIPPADRTYQASATPDAYTGARIRATAPAAPDPVTDLSAVATGSTTVQLSWTAVAGADEYNIQRAPNNGLWSSIDATASTSYDDAGLTASSPYQYRIFTSNENGWGDVSNIATTITEDDVTPPPSGGVTDLTKIRWSADWSEEPDGVPANKDSFYGMYNIYNGVVSSEKLLNGRKTIKEVCDWGPDQFWGTGFGRYVGAPYGEQNAEIWFRVWVYHDPGFSWTTDAKLRKTMRQGEELESGAYAGGYADLYTVWPDYFRGSEPGGINYFRESVQDGPEGGWWPLDPTAASEQQTGVWECLEFYVKSNSNAGQGAIKYWKNGVLINEVPNCRTRLNADGALVKCLFINNWNAGLDKVCTYWWCAPAIAVRNSTRDDVPFMDQDPSGFPFIGEAT